MQRWLEARARTELSMYNGTAAETLDERRADFRAFSRSLLMRVQLTRTDAWWAWGRLWLACVDDPNLRRRALKEAAKSARRLDRNGLGYTSVCGLLLRAAVATQKQDPQRAVADLRAAVTAAEAGELAVYAATAHRRLGELVGGDEGAALVARADAWMRGEEIANPERITKLLAPGFATD